MMAEPKLFISYCWSSAEHEEWVLRLGTELRENGVDVILDKWDLKEGNDANAFMEKMVSDEEIKKVILVIDDQYSERANSRSGGVGTETQIISAEVYESVEQNKFVAVIANKDHDGTAKLPVFYKSRIYIDLSDEDLYSKNFEQLLRWVYDKPLNIKPGLGEKPKFLEDELSVSLGTSVAFRRLVDAMKNSRPYAQGALVEYLNLFSVNLNKFRLEQSNGATDFDQDVVDSVENFIPFRNELIEVFAVTAQYDNSKSSALSVHKFFESLIPYLDVPEGVQRYHKWDWDNLKFLIHESFLLCIAIYLKYERFDNVEHLIKQHYYVSKDEDYGQSKMRPFGVFRTHLESLTYRNTRLTLNRSSVHADLIKERCTDSGISFNQIMQADFLLYVVDELRELKEGTYKEWYPVTLVFKTFHAGAFEMFLRAESEDYFKKIAPMLGIKSKLELEPLVKGLQDGSLPALRWDSGRVDQLALLNYENLCSHA